MTLRRFESGGTEPHGETDTDLHLLERWQAGDRKAGISLVRRYHEDLAHFFRNSVDDEVRLALIAKTFQRLSKSHEPFRRDAGTRTHLFQLARQALLDHLREVTPGSTGAFDPLAHSIVEVSGVTASQAVASLRSTRPLLESLRALPYDAKQLLELQYWHGCTPGELGKIFEQSEDVIRQRLPDAKAALRRVLAKRGQMASSGEDDQALEQALRALGTLVFTGSGSSLRAGRQDPSHDPEPRPQLSPAPPHDDSAPPNGEPDLSEGARSE